MNHGCSCTHHLPVYYYGQHTHVVLLAYCFIWLDNNRYGLGQSKHACSVRVASASSGTTMPTPAPGEGALWQLGGIILIIIIIIVIIIIIIVIIVIVIVIISFVTIGRHYLSNATCLMQPHVFCACFVVSRSTILCYILRQFWRTSVLDK